MQVISRLHTRDAWGDYYDAHKHWVLRFPHSEQGFRTEAETSSVLTTTFGRRSHIFNNESDKVPELMIYNL